VKWRALLVGVAAVACLPAAVAGDDARGRLLPLTPAEVKAILRHGPWPVRWTPDPSNRVSGKPEAIAFGERLFFDARLSLSGALACASCHIPEREWTDGRKVAVGLEEVDRNTPSLHNVRLNRWFGWDGAGDSLWAQSVRPLLDPREMGGSARHVAETVRSDTDLACRYHKAFGAAPSQSDDDAVLVDAAKALAAFQETLVTGRTPFDDFREALARGDRKAAARYPESAQRGLRIFIGKGRCSLCHFGPSFTNGEFEEIGIPHYIRSGGIDWGRAQGIKMMQASRFNRLRGYSDDRSGVSAESSRHVALAWRNYGEFKIPSLRNAARTPPYMHNGHVATLTEVVRHYSEIDVSRLHLGPEPVDSDGAAIDPELPTVLRPLNLSDEEIADVVAFLETLTEWNPAPRRTPPLRPCGP
jgi:cytochrome c peroxidase